MVINNRNSLLDNFFLKKKLYYGCLPFQINFMIAEIRYSSSYN